MTNILEVAFILVGSLYVYVVYRLLRVAHMTWREQNERDYIREKMKRRLEGADDGNKVQ